MKKLFALTLTLVLSLVLFVAAPATPFYLESAGVTIEVPDGFTGTDQSDAENNVLLITVDDDDSVAFVYVVRYMDVFAGKWLEDLSEEEAEQLGMGIAVAIDDPQVDIGEVDGYPVVIAASGDGTELHYIALLNGWLLDLSAIKTDGASLSDEEIEAAAYLLWSVTFDGEE